MLDKADRRYLRSSDPTAIVGSIQGAVYQLGIQLQQTGPNIWVGRGNQASYAMVPKVAVTIAPIQDGVCVDVRVTADFEQNGIILFVVAWIFFFPAAVIMAVLGYQDWEKRATWTLSAIWTPLTPQMMNPPAPAWGPPLAAPPGAPGAPPGAPGGYGSGQGQGPGWGPPR
jgi:hypothetical protein